MIFYVDFNITIWNRANC